MENVKLSREMHAINIIVFLFALLFKSVVDGLVIKDNPTSPLNWLKYIILIIGILLYSYEMYHKYRASNKNIFFSEFKVLMLMFAGIIAISLAQSFIMERVTFYTVKECLFWGLPIVFSFCALNVLSFKELMFCVKSAVIILAVGYMLQVGFENFSLHNIWSAFTDISFSGGDNSSSNSLLETSAFPDSFMALFFFFTYYRKNNYLWFFATFFLVILANKRVMIAFALVIMVIVLFQEVRQRLSQKTKIKIQSDKKHYAWIFFVILFMFMPFIVIFLMRPDIETGILMKTGISLSDFWMGRDVMVNNIIHSNFKSFGLGSTYIFQKSLLEVEGVKIYIELGLIGLFLVTFSYWKIVRKNSFCLLVMFYNFININTSTSFTTGAFAWIFYIILIGCCLYFGKNQKETLSIA